MILHIPHASTKTWDTDKFIEETKREAIDKLTDWYTDELFYHEFATPVVFPWSRVFCDVERFRNNEDESMSKLGMGVVYRKGLDGKNLLKDVTTLEAEEKIKSSFYDRHHRKFSVAVNRSLGLFPVVFVVDCHSFYPTKLAHEESSDRPDFCIGTDDFHTPVEVVDEVKAYLEGLGFTVSINSPFKGTMVPLIHLHKNEDVKSIMIEVNRKLYLKAPYIGEKNDNFESIQNVLTGLLEIISEYEISKET
ncbi:N-formylglutamate amidohydrolase [Alkalimarinus alittae]|uniref:N-formylglutamate amidohydrolase n=1 Tax=Alkalimarinus alittae TaxID=2961619 RepID=A0ABY6N5M7_9ALTE|nr:N-formylglutamate amidohydrolase [Alkalimarinus alittae]UZE97292.1 N-formylglutamate amidohydrolase [Alkalimarinus alittae]